MDDRNAVIDRLAELPRLPKPHYSAAIPPQQINLANGLLHQFTRITGSLCLNGQYCSEGQVFDAVVICARATANLAIGYNAWSEFWNDALPPTDQGPLYVEELKMLASRLAKIQLWVDQANHVHLPDTVNVRLVIFNSESFHVAYRSEEWRAAVRAKHDAFYTVAKQAFPDAPVEWYNFGAVVPSTATSGWTAVDNHDLAEKHDAHSVGLYRGSEIGYIRESYRRTATATEDAAEPVTPFIALAAGYRMKADGSGRQFGPWDYDPMYSWALGREINTKWFGDRPARFAPWNRAERAIFYPAPFNPRFPDEPFWRHFEAYARGAALREFVVTG